MPDDGRRVFSYGVGSDTTSRTVPIHISDRVAIDTDHDASMVKSVEAPVRPRKLKDIAWDGSSSAAASGNHPPIAPQAGINFQQSVLVDWRGGVKYPRVFCGANPTHQTDSIGADVIGGYP